MQKLSESEPGSQDYYIDKSTFHTHASNYSGEDMPDGMDYQGVRWNILMHQASRSRFRERRTSTYHSHRQFQDAIPRRYPLRKIRKEEPYYTFEKYYKIPDLWCGHFQLKHNVLVPTKTDLIYPYRSGFIHYSLLTFKERKFSMEPDLHPVCIDYHNNLVALGALEGELVLYNLQKEKTLFMKPIMEDKSINNCVAFLKQNNSSSSKIACGGNDNTLQIFDIQDEPRLVLKLEMTDAVNTLRLSPDGKILLSLGDKKEADLIDPRTGRIITELAGHEDFGFAGDWHPDGNYLVTGNQDCTCRVWDLRNTRRSVHVLQSQLDSPNVVKYSPNGSYLAVGENADMVDIYNVEKDYMEMQVIDFFGEMNGVSFDGEEGDNLMIGALLEGHNGVFEYSIKKTEHMSVLSHMMF